MMVAIRAEEGSTRTVGAIGIQLGLGLLTRGVDVDSVLSGPTNLMWIDPWVSHLRTLGVQFHNGAAVRHLHTDGARISRVTIEQDGRISDVTADYYVAALPVEVMTSLLTDDLKRAAPSLANIGRLRTAWMNGIQFYLGRCAPIVHGHIVYVDSPWALTSVSQDQFWGSVDLTGYGDGEVKGILSVDISDWETPGMLYGRPARECDAVEIKNEVWLQILAHLDVEGQRQLKDARIMRWFLDPSIVYPNPSRATNLEPLLINTAGSLADSAARAYRDSQLVPGVGLRQNPYGPRVHGGRKRGWPAGGERAARQGRFDRTARGGLAPDRTVGIPMVEGMGPSGVRARRGSFHSARDLGGAASATVVPRSSRPASCLQAHARHGRMRRSGTVALHRRPAQNRP